MTTVNATSTPYWREESTNDPHRRRVRAHIGGLHCSLCTGTIEKAIGRRAGVHKVSVSLTHEQALVEYDPSVTAADALMQTLKDIGYTISDPRKVEPFERQERALVRERNRFLVALACSLAAVGLIANHASVWGLALAAFVFSSLIAFALAVLRRQGWGRALAGAMAMAGTGVVLFILRVNGLTTSAGAYVTAALALTMIFGVGGHILRMAIQTLRRGILNQHVLVEIGAFAGLAGGMIGLIAHPANYPTAPFFAVAVMILTYHIFSEWLSLVVKTRSSQAVKKLLDLQPDTARVVKAGEEEEVPIEQVAIHDHVRIRPGDRIPVDGNVIDGHSAVDESLITGEPIPVDKSQGDAVAGGAINGMGTLLVEVTAVGEQSFLQQVVRSVEDARALKPGLLHLVDRVLRIYTPTVLLIAATALVVWLVSPWVAGHGVDVQRAVFAALSVLVMGYPCAVGISAPLSIVRGAGEAADRGILMRTGEAFQALRKVRTVVLDKTGTLTEGKPAVREIEPYKTDESELLALAAAVEAASEHPLAQAIVQAALEKKIELPPVADFQATAGQGVEARCGGASILVGSANFLEARGADVSPLHNRMAELEGLGRTVILVGRDAQLLGLLAMGDELRVDAVAAVDQLKQLGIQTVLLTGDNERTARRVAGQANIEHVYADVQPEGKAKVIRDLQQHSHVAMVGDGINDAPSLMQANVGIAMGSGTDIAIDSADVIILNTKLTAVAEAYKISRRGYRKMLQNVALAFAFNGIGIPVAATGLINPVWAMVAMAASVTAIFVNSLWGQPGLLFNAVSEVGQPTMA